MAIPQGGFFKDKVEQGRYGPIFPKSPACYGFSIIAKIIPGREPTFHEYAKNIEKAVASQPDILAVLKLHYLRWNLFKIKGETYFQYIGIFDTDFDTQRMQSDFFRHLVSAPFSRIWRAFLRIGRRMPRDSSNSSASISTRASLNMANTLS
jgi:hypothetical protein